VVRVNIVQYGAFPKSGDGTIPRVLDLETGTPIADALNKLVSRMPGE
jgi:hypothetical protein